MGVVLTLILAFVAAVSGTVDPFRVEGLPPAEVFVVSGEDPGAAAFHGVPMLGRLAGVLGRIEPQGLVALRRGLGPGLAERPAGATDRATIHLRRGSAESVLRLQNLPGGGLALADPASGQSWRIEAGAVASCGVPWWRADWAPAAAEAGSTARLAGGVGAELVLEPAEARRVLRASFSPLSRRVDEAVFHERLPRTHDPARPSPVLVWISPTPDGRLPPMFEPTLDALGTIAIGVDDAGNGRPVIDRLQLALDAVETVRRRHLVDDERVYLAGFSGGGRCASILAITLPDAFAGAVSIGGLDSYHDAPTGRSGEHWAARFGRPVAPILRRLRDRRIVAVVGEMDFNRAEAEARVGLLRDDGVQARTEVIPGVGHALPDADTFRKSLLWVDEPARSARAEAASRAAQLLAGLPEGPATDPIVRDALVDVILAGPWSPAAWTAAERLGYDRASFLSGRR